MPDTVAHVGECPEYYSRLLHRPVTVVIFCFPLKIVVFVIHITSSLYIHDIQQTYPLSCIIT